MTHEFSRKELTVPLDPKKLQVLHMALTFFSEKGYLSTSMQEIAAACGMSKGSLYKLFPSKEELLVQTFDYHQEAMFEQAARQTMAAELRPSERLVERLIVQIDDFLEKRAFISMQFRELPVQESEKLAALLRRNKQRMRQWHYDCLREAYGEPVQPYIWDLVMIYQGILKEYLFIHLQEHAPLSVREVATYLVGRMDAIVHDLLTTSPPPLLQHLALHDDCRPCVPPTKQDVLRALGSAIERATLTVACRDEARQTYELLVQETEAAEPRRFLIRALLSDLAAEPALQLAAEAVRKDWL